MKDVASGEACTKRDQHAVSSTNGRTVRRFAPNAARVSRCIEIENAIHPVPAEVAQQSPQAGLGPAKIDVMPKARFEPDAIDARLLRVDLPRMKIKNRRPFVDSIDTIDRQRDNAYGASRKYPPPRQAIDRITRSAEEFRVGPIAHLYGKRVHTAS